MSVKLVFQLKRANLTNKRYANASNYCGIIDTYSTRVPASIMNIWLLNNTRHVLERELIRVCFNVFADMYEIEL